MKRVVSVSLGSPARNKTSVAHILGQEFQIERIGTNGDLRQFSKLFKELDGKVDAIGIGGADLHVYLGQKRYTFRQIQRLVSGATSTPTVDGSGLKNTLEREAVLSLQKSGIVDFSQEKVLIVSSVDRYGMAQTLSELCNDVIYGDFLYSLGLPIPITHYKGVLLLGSLILPIAIHLPFKWFYPTGEKQEKNTPRFSKYFNQSTLIAGDWHYIKRYAPSDLSGKTILTQTLRKADFDWLKLRNVRRAITTTPVIQGETFATNVMEGVLVSLLGKRAEEASVDEYLEQLRALKWEPTVFDLS